MSELENELENLRIPFEKIKIHKGIEVRGYGSVFEGELNDRPVALKRINITNLAHIKPKLLAEIRHISRFRKHPNLVALLGFCDEKSNEIILVFEYVSSGSLLDYMRKHLTTVQRLEICISAARGLDYLNTGVDPDTPGIVHGDVKPSKILLNKDSTLSKFEAKISNFGLSKVLPGRVRDHVEPSPEYRDPVYEVTGKVTKESDVYSLGVVLLEVLCGVPELVDTDDYQERHVTELVPKRLQQNKLRKIVHFDIRNEFKTEALETFVKIACRCVMKKPEDRPTMAQVVEQLEEALRLQGGEVPPVPYLSSNNGDDLPEQNQVEEDKKDDDNGNIEEKMDGLNSGNRIEGKKEDQEKISISSSSGSSNGDNSNSSDHLLEEKKEADNITMSTPVLVLGGEEGENVPEETLVENAQKTDENTVVMSTKDLEIEGQIVDSLTSNEKSNHIGEVKEESPSSSSSSEINNGDSSTGIPDHFIEEKKESEGITMPWQSSSVPVLGGEIIIEETHVEDCKRDDENSVVLMANDPEIGEEIADDLGLNGKPNIIGEVKDEDESQSNSSSLNSNHHQQKNAAENITVVEEQDSEITNLGDTNARIGNANSANMNLYDTEKKNDVIMVVNGRSYDDFASNDEKFKFVTKTQENESNSSTSSKSSNGDDTNPSHHLLPHKSPAHNITVKKVTNGSRTCCSWCSSWKHFFSVRLALYGELFWNNLVSICLWIKRRITHKRD